MLATADRILDCKGMVCPQPLLETFKALKKMKIGETLEVFGDFPLSKEEIPKGMEEAGQEIISISQEAGIWKIVIKKVT